MATIIIRQGLNIIKTINDFTPSEYPGMVPENFLLEYNGNFIIIFNPSDLSHLPASFQDDLPAKIASFHFGKWSDFVNKAETSLFEDNERIITLSSRKNLNLIE